VLRYVDCLQDESSRSSGAPRRITVPHQNHVQPSCLPRCGVMAGFMRCTICDITTCLQGAQHTAWQLTQCLFLACSWQSLPCPGLAPATRHCKSVTMVFVSLPSLEPSKRSVHEPLATLFTVLVTITKKTCPLVSRTAAPDQLSCAVFPPQSTNTRQTSRNPRCRSSTGFGYCLTVNTV
jgi:hypothetical protein